MLVDIAAHILPPRHFEHVVAAAPNGHYLQKRVRTVPELWDLDARFAVMDDFAEYDYRQVLTLANPPIERIVPRSVLTETCRSANEELRDLVDRHPDRFVGAFGYLPLTDPDAAVAEMDRLREIGLAGFELYTDVDGVPLDDPAVLPILDEACARGIPMFLHPARDASHTDYPTEASSRFEMWQILGWPYATSVAMVRLALSGLFERHPEAVLITHHAGGMVPFFSSRIEHGLSQLGSRTDGDEYAGVLERLPEGPHEYLRRFSCDTALSGAPGAVRLAADYFGVERMYFGSDMPFDKAGGRTYIAQALDAVSRSGLSEEDTNRILCENAVERVLRHAVNETLS